MDVMIAERHNNGVIKVVPRKNGDKSSSTKYLGEIGLCSHVQPVAPGFEVGYHLAPPKSEHGAPQWMFAAA
jgi:hypothetical protein